MSHTYLKILNQGVEINTSSKEVSNLIHNDFSFFISPSVPSYIQLHVDVRIEHPKHSIPENLLASFQTENCINYDVGDIRYSDYFGELTTIFNFNHNSAIIISENINMIHEVLYLLILSRIGKSLDLKGFHRIHAFGVKINHLAILGIGNSKVGKSTLLCSLLQDSDIEFFSDDTPLIDRKGRIHAFPLRIGLSESVSMTESDSIYTITRKKYGKKKLLPITAIKNKISQDYQSSVLVFLHRSTLTGPSIYKISKFSALKKLLAPMIVGVGTPIIFEYFWVHTYADLFTKTFIALSRTFSAIALSLKSQSYNFYLSDDIQSNAHYFRSYRF